MKRKMKGGTTSVSLPIRIRDTSSSVGAGLGSLAYNTAGLTAEYRRKGQSSWTAITLASKTLGTYTSGGFVADGARAGYYEFDPPDAAVASGAAWVAIRLYGATNMEDTSIEIELDAVDYQDGTAFGLSRIDAAISSRSTYSGSDTAGTTTLLARLTSTRAGLLDNLDAAISTRSTYAGGDTAGTTTLLGRLTSTRAGLLDNLDAAISTRLAPTVTGRTLDVSAGGEAGIDWANIGSPTSTVALTGTTIDLVSRTGFKLASDGLDSITIETGLNARQALAIMSAESAGNLAGAAGSTITFTGAGVATNRITATVDTSGNRTGIVLNPPA